MMSPYLDELLLARAGIHRPLGGLHGSPFNNRYRHGLDRCTTSFDHPYTQHHVCQCEQLLEIGHLVQDSCDCLDCPYSNAYPFDDYLYSGYGR